MLLPRRCGDSELPRHCVDSAGSSGAAAELPRRCESPGAAGAELPRRCVDSAGTGGSAEVPRHCVDSWGAAELPRRYTDSPTATAAASGGAAELPRRCVDSAAVVLPRPGTGNEISPGSIDASLPRKFDAGVTGKMDSSLPRKLDSRDLKVSSASRKSEPSPKRHPSPDKMERPASRLSAKRVASPEKLVYSSRPLKSPDKLDASMKKSDFSTKGRASPEIPRKLDQMTSTPGNVSPSKATGETSSRIMLDAITALLHDEIKQKIHEISEKIEPRFGSFERALNKTTKNMELQLDLLESRVKSLETRLLCEPENNACYFKNESANKSTGFCSPPRTMHDAREVHPVWDDHPPQRELSTPELIATVKARCNKTNELLGRRLI